MKGHLRNYAHVLVCIAAANFVGTTLQEPPQQDASSGTCSDDSWGKPPGSNWTKGSDVNAVDENNWTPLHWAVLSNDHDRVDQLLGQEADPNIADAFGRTPLHIAATTEPPKSSFNIAESLIRHGANVNATCRYLHESPQARKSVTPLHLAARHGNLDLVKLLIDRRASLDARNSFNSTPLHEAVWQYTGAAAQIVAILLEAGANAGVQNMHGNTPLHVAVERGRGSGVLGEFLARPKTALAAVNLPNKAGLTPLLLAVILNSNDGDAALEIQHAGGNVFKTNADGSNALHLAIMRKNPEMARKMFIMLHRRPVCTAASIDNLNQDGKFALELAIDAGYDNVVEELIRAGAQVNQIFRSSVAHRTPLHLAASKGNQKIVEILLRNGAVVNARNAEGRTAARQVLLESHFSRQGAAHSISEMLKRHGSESD